MNDVINIIVGSGNANVGVSERNVRIEKCIHMTRKNELGSFKVVSETP